MAKILSSGNRLNTKLFFFSNNNKGKANFTSCMIPPNENLSSLQISPILDKLLALTKPSVSLVPTRKDWISTSLYLGIVSPEKLINPLPDDKIKTLPN